MSEEVFMRMLFRKMAPKITDTLMKAALTWGENVNDLFMTIRHDPNGDLDDPDACIYFVRSSKTKNKQPLMKDTNRLDEEDRDTLEEIFPVTAELLSDAANEWGLTPHQVFIKIGLIPGKDFKKGESISFKILSNAGLLETQKCLTLQ